MGSVALYRAATLVTRAAAGLTLHRNMGSETPNSGVLTQYKHNFT